MKKWLSIGTCAVLLCLAVSSALAQQKTVRACQEEWRANKADNQAKGITEKAYVAQCRVAAQPAPSPAAPSPTTQPAPGNSASGSQKTVRACQEEWRANKAENQAKGITERAYVAECRAGGVASPSAGTPSTPTETPANASPETQKTVRTCQEEWRSNRAAYQAAKITEKAYVQRCRAGEAVALPTSPAPNNPAAAAPVGTQSQPPAAPTQAPAPKQARPAEPTSAPAQAPAPTQAAAPANPAQFQSESQAKAHCPADLVVWANLTSKIYHFAGHKSYGTTKQGAYMCEKDATAEGFRASKTEKRPST